MDKFDKWSLSLSLRIALVLAAIGFLADFLGDLMTSGWDFAAISPNLQTILFALLILAVSLVAQFSTNKFFTFARQVIEGISDLRSSIRADTADIVGNITSGIEEFKRKLSEGIVKHENYTYRALVYHEDKGEIYNAFSGGEPSSRNILFSNKTMNLIFRGIKDMGGDALKRIGRKSSESFARELVGDIRKSIHQLQKRKPGEAIDLHGWIQHWISFDSNAGFGKFFVPDREKWQKQETKTIVLKYSFLAQDYEKGQPRICDFMTGYIEGILNNFPPNVLAPYRLQPGNVAVSHDTNNHEQCICADRDPGEGCVFFINRLK